MSNSARWWRSIRVRLTLTYSLALFVVGTLVLAAIYIGLSRALDDEPISQTYVAQGVFTRDDGRIVVIPVEIQREFRSVESLANERALEQLRTWSFGALGTLVILSLGIGWIVAHRVLRPIDHITDVARDIQATDLSRRIALDGPDDELTRLAGTFDDMLGRLDRAFEAQRRFVHEASHELRNPLATIRTNLEVALADPDASAADLRQTAEVVDRSTERMGHVVDDLLSFARSEMPDREYTVVDVHELVHEVSEEFAGSAEASGVGLRITGAARNCVRGDAAALRRVVANLLANALEHSPSGSTVSIAVRDHGRGVQLVVSDSGAGIPVRDRHLVFRRGWRSSAARAQRPTGSGLGLTIVRQVVEQHGGTVRADEAADGSGAAFVIDLPGEPLDRGSADAGDLRARSV